MSGSAWNQGHAQTSTRPPLTLGLGVWPGVVGREHSWRKPRGWQTTGWGWEQTLVYSPGMAVPVVANGRRRQSGCRGCPHEQRAAGPGCLCSGSGTTPGGHHAGGVGPLNTVAPVLLHCGAWGQCGCNWPARVPGRPPGLDTHQFETHSVLAIQGPQPRRWISVQLEGGLWTWDLGPQGIPAVAKVEPIQGVDVLPGKVIQNPQMVAG